MVLCRKRWNGWGRVVAACMLVLCATRGVESSDDFDSSWDDAHASMMSDLYELLFDSSWGGNPSFLIPEVVTEPGFTVAVNEVGFPLIIEFGSMAGTFTPDLPHDGVDGAAGAIWTR